MKSHLLQAPAALSLVLLVSACGTAPRSAAPEAAAGQLELRLASGTYGCDEGVRLQVERETLGNANTRIRIAWNGVGYRLDRDPSYSGLPRFEDTASGLVWIDLPSKGLLLDSRSSRPLANECRPV